MRIRLADSDSDFLVSLADGRAKIVAREAVEANGDLKQGPTVGSGPWRMTDSIQSAFHRFERNATYFEEDLPFADALMMHIMPDASTRNAAFDVGTLDVHQLDPDEWGRLVQRRPDVRSTLVRESGVGLEVALNTSRPPFHDVDVRRAVFRAMDPWAAIDQTWSGTAYVSAGFPVIEPGWLLDDRDLRPFFAQPQRARDLLEAGGGGAAYSVAITVGDFGGRYLTHAQRIATELEAVGFEPTVNVVNQRRFGEAVWLGGDYQMFVGPVAPVTSPNGYLVPVLHSLGAWNTTAHVDEDLDALIEAQAREPDPVIASAADTRHTGGRLGPRVPFHARHPEEHLGLMAEGAELSPELRRTRVRPLGPRLARRLAGAIRPDPVVKRGPGEQCALDSYGERSHSGQRPPARADRHRPARTPLRLSSSYRKHGRGRLSRRGLLPTTAADSIEPEARLIEQPTTWAPTRATRPFSSTPIWRWTSSPQKGLTPSAVKSGSERGSWLRGLPECSRIASR